MTSKVARGLACSITIVFPIVTHFRYLSAYAQGQVTQIRFSDWTIPKILASDWLGLKPLPFTTNGEWGMGNGEWGMG